MASRTSPSATMTLEEVDALVDTVLNKKTRHLVDPVKLWETGLAQANRNYVEARWPASRQNAVSRRSNKLSDAFRAVHGFYEAQWKIDRVWEISYRGKSYYERWDLGFVCARTDVDAANVGWAKYATMITVWTDSIRREGLTVREVKPGSWGEANKLNMEKAAQFSKKIAEVSESIKQYQAKLDGYRQQQLLLLEEVHGG